MSLAEAGDVCRKKVAQAPFILYDNNLEACHPSMSSVSVYCFRKGYNLLYIVIFIRFKNFSHI